MPRSPLWVFGIWSLVWHVIERSSAAQVVGPSYRHIDNVFRFDLRDPVTNVSGQLVLTRYVTEPSHLRACFLITDALASYSMATAKRTNKNQSLDRNMCGFYQYCGGVQCLTDFCLGTLCFIGFRRRD